MKREEFDRKVEELLDRVAALEREARAPKKEFVRPANCSRRAEAPKMIACAR
jgi:hypothetical protein